MNEQEIRQYLMDKYHLHDAFLEEYIGQMKRWGVDDQEGIDRIMAMHRATLPEDGMNPINGDPVTDPVTAPWVINPLDPAAGSAGSPWYKKYFWLEVLIGLVALNVALWLIFRKK